MIGLELEANAKAIAEIEAAKVSFQKRQKPKHAFTEEEFKAAMREAHDGVTGLDTDTFDLRQRIEPLINNPNLTTDQVRLVTELRQRMYAVLTEQGLIDGWNTAIRDVSDAE